MTMIEEIKRLKQEKNVLILAHYYTEDAVQTIADVVGDSYLLSKKAAASKASTILFCGVEFMGESAVILSPEKRVLMPDLSADCPMAHMVTPEDVARVRAAHPGIAVVCYINSTAEIKACADVCVTSSNAERVVKALDAQEIYFIPDANLGRHIAEKIPEKTFYCHDGYCPVHAKITAEKVMAAKAAHPGAKVLMHPECVPEALALADYIGSTSGIIDFPEKDGGGEYIIATEAGVLYALKNRYPGVSFYMASEDCICEDMKKNSLEKVYEVLKNADKVMTMDEGLRKRAEHSLKAMHRLASQEVQHV
ncbi:MAG: quinolinate synthase NadA [Eubacterium sp.]|nr:quinolinate synthase NadA [Eubacterium sp.]